MFKKLWRKLTTPKLTAKKALKILAPIPEEKWTTHTLEDQQFRMCALGHLNTHFGGNSHANVVTVDEFNDHVLEFMQLEHEKYANIADVNDSDTINGYTEDHPKKRVIHLLTDMQKAGF